MSEVSTETVKPFTMDEQLAAARALYEGTPGMTFAVLSEQTGIGKTMLSRQAKVQGWKKDAVAYRAGQMSEAAQRAADLFRHKLEDFGPEVSAGQQQEVAEQTVGEFALEARAKLLDRHRQEWAAPRAMSAEAVRQRDANPTLAFEKAKLAKITAETLKLVQDGERKAWGLDVGDVPEGHVVVIERA